VIPNYNELKYATWNGASWEIEIVDSDNWTGAYTSLMLDSFGYPRISYYDLSEHELRYTAWNGSRWDCETVDTNHDVGYYTSLALDSFGYPHISYFSYTSSSL
jgi:hypothetical protein